jgi:hypothetical protein
MLKPQKAPGLDPITAKMLNELPEKTVKALMHIFNAIPGVAYRPVQLRTA